MLWCTDMACGIHLGILLIFVQADHTCCSWSTQAQSSQRQHGNTYAGFSQKDSDLTKPNYSQNKFRQASSSLGSYQSSSFNPQPKVGSGNRLFSKSSPTQPVSQPPRQSSVKYIKVEPSNLNWPTIDSTKVGPQQMPHKRFHGFSTDNSVVKYGTSEAKLVRPSSLATAQSTGQYTSSNSPSVQGLAGQNVFASSQQFGPQMRYNAESSGAQGNPLPARRSTLLGNSGTSATARARRVYPRRNAAKHSHLASARNGRIGSAQGGYQQSAFGPRSLRTSHRFHYNSLTAPLQNQPGSWYVAPTRTITIPNQFGGFAIRRLQKPANQVFGVQNPQQKQTVPSQQATSYSKHGRSFQEQSRWMNG